MASRLLLLAAVASSLFACNDPPPRAPTPPGDLVPPVALSGSNDETPVDPALGKPDAWYDAYSGYMIRDTQREYLSTPEDERFERFGLLLLDYQLREDLLRKHQDELTRDDQDAYRRLPSAEECRKFIRDHAQVTSPGTTGGHK